MVGAVGSTMIEALGSGFVVDGGTHFTVFTRVFVVKTTRHTVPSIVRWWFCFGSRRVTLSISIRRRGRESGRGRIGIGIGH